MKTKMSDEEYEKIIRQCRPTIEHGELVLIMPHGFDVCIIGRTDEQIRTQVEKLHNEYMEME